MLAALSMIGAHWATHPEAAAVVQLAERSRDPEVRAKIARRGSPQAH
jgi:hypothetical protein